MKIRKSLKMNALLNVIRQCCVILFPMITFPYASRVLGAASYGKINFGLSIISYITLIAGLGINNYAIREGSRIKSMKKNFNLFVDEIFSLNIMSTVIAYFLLFGAILCWTKLHSYTGLLLIQSTVVLFTTIGAEWINIIYEDYIFITIRYIICQTLAVILMFLFVKDSADYVLYAITSTSGIIFANIMNIIHIRKDLGIKIKFHLSKGIKKHVRPVFIMFSTSIASLIYINSDVTLLGLMTNDTTVGYYSVSVKIYSLVKQLFNAMLMVCVPRFSGELVNGNREKVNSQLENIINILILVLGSAAVGLVMLSKNIILIFAGHGYLPAVNSLKILAVALGFAAVACFYINVVMLPYQMEKKILQATMLSAGFNVVLNIVLIPFYGEIAAAMTTLVSEIIMVILGVYYSNKIIKFHCIKSLILCGVGMIWTFFSCHLMKSYFVGNIITIFGAMILTGIGLLMLFYIGYRNKIFTDFRK